MLMLAMVALIGYKHGTAAAGCSFVVGSLALEGFLKRPQTGLCFVWTGASLADIFIPEVYASIETNDSLETFAFVNSGVAVTNPLLQAAAESGAKKVEIPIWNDLDATVEPDYVDESEDDIEPGKVDTDSYNARNGFMAKSYGATDLSIELSGTTPGGGSPMTRIKNRFGTYWAGQFQRRILAMGRGIMLTNVANHSSDMVHKVALETTVGVGATHKINSDAVMAAVFTMGDRFADMRVIAMHSTPYATLVGQQLIDFVRDADGTLLYPTYLGLRVVVDDTMPVRAGTTSGLVYTTMIFGGGIFGYGEGTPSKPAEVYREPTKGKGGGREAIIERKTWMIHPIGHNWTEDTVTGLTPTLANLRLAANWERILPRKKVPIAFLDTNG
jgi:hypothetical protein